MRICLVFDKDEEQIVKGNVYLFIFGNRIINASQMSMYKGLAQQGYYLDFDKKFNSDYACVLSDRSFYITPDYVWLLRVVNEAYGVHLLLTEELSLRKKAATYGIDLSPDDLSKELFKSGAVTIRKIRISKCVNLLEEYRLLTKSVIWNMTKNTDLGYSFDDSLIQRIYKAKDFKPDYLITGKVYQLEGTNIYYDNKGNFLNKQKTGKEIRVFDKELTADDLALAYLLG